MVLDKILSFIPEKMIELSSHDAFILLLLFIGSLIILAIAAGKNNRKNAKFIAILLYLSIIKVVEFLYLYYK